MDVTNWGGESKKRQNCIWARISNPFWKNPKITFSFSIKAPQSFLGSRPKGGQGLEVMMTMRMVMMVLIKGKLWRLQLL